MLVIPNTTLDDEYTTEHTWLGGPFSGGSFVVANNPAAVQLFLGEQGQPTEGPETYLPPGVYPVGGGSGNRRLLGIRAKNYLPGSNVQFFGSFAHPNEASIGGSSAFDSTIGASGEVTSGVVEYLPVWTSTAVQPNFGNAGIEAAYVKNGLHVHVDVNILFGNTTTFGTGQWNISLPVAQDGRFATTGIALFGDTGVSAYAGVWLNGFLYWYRTDGVTALLNGTTNNAPFVWGSGDNLILAMDYIAAS